MSDHAPFPLCKNQISNLPPPHILVKTISQVTILARTLATVPTTFINPHKMECYYNLTGTQATADYNQNILLYPSSKIFNAKLPPNLLCTVINIGPNDITLSKNRHIGELAPYLTMMQS